MHKRLCAPALLPWQLFFLIFVAGIAASRETWTGLLALPLLGFLLYRHFSNQTILLLLPLLFSAGFFYAKNSTPLHPPTPEWLEQHFLHAHRIPSRSKPILAEGEVIWTKNLDQQRQQILLKNLRPSRSLAGSTKDNTEEKQALQKPAPITYPENDPCADCTAYQGLTLWSGPALPNPPLKGQSFKTFMVLTPLRGLANANTWNPEQFQHDQNIWLRARTPNNSPVRVSGSGNMGSRLRNKLYLNFITALPKAQLSETTPDQDPGSSEKNQKIEAAAPNTPRILKSIPALEKIERDKKLPAAAGLTEGASLLPALIFGDRSFISKTNSELISKSTLAHSLALSGLHLGYALFFGWLAASCLKRIHPRLLTFCPFALLSLVLGMPFALLYLWLGQAPISLTRAFGMFCAMTLLLLFRKPAILSDTLLMALACILLYSPLALFDIRLQLSALSITAIILFLPSGQFLSRLIFQRRVSALDPAQASTASASPGPHLPEEKTTTYFLPSHTPRPNRTEERAAQTSASALQHPAQNSCADQKLLNGPHCVNFFAPSKTTPETELRQNSTDKIIFPPKQTHVVLSSKAAWIDKLCLQSTCLTLLKTLKSILFYSGKSIFDLFFLSCAIQIFLLPFIIETFNRAGVWMPLNVLWLPVLGFAVMPLAFCGLLFSAFHCTHAAELMLSFAELPCSLLLKLLVWMNDAGILYAPLLPRPHWTFIAGFWVLLAALPLIGETLRLNKQKRLFPQTPPQRQTVFFISAFGLIICSGGLFYPLFAAPTGVTIRIFDVGHAQAICIQWKTEHGQGRLLLDGGDMRPNGFDMGKNIVAPALTYMHRPRLDHAVNTHTDSDHLGGMLFILDHFRLGNFGKSDDEPSPALNELYQKILRARNIHPRIYSAGDEIHLAHDLQLKVLWPKPLSKANKKRPSRNQRSLVLLLTWQEKPLALFCGDAEAKELTALSKERADLHVPLLLIPHHGSTSSFSKPFYHTVVPQIAVASCRFAANGEFICQATHKALQQLGAAIFTTAQSGELRVHFDSPDAQASVQTERPGQKKP